MTRGRFNFILNKSHRLMIVRPIGDLAGDVFAERVIASYSAVEAPWRYNRILDFRRHEGVVGEADRHAIIDAWQSMTAGKIYHANVARLPRDPDVQFRVPTTSVPFPNETVCLFADYHEAVGWLLAFDKTNYLRALGPIEPSRLITDNRVKHM